MTIYEIPDGLPQLRSFLLGEFKGIIPPGATGSAEERERNYLSRALAAYAVQKLAECSKEDAAGSVVDGGGDGGIDAIYYAKQTTGTLWIIQSKFVSSGRGEPDGLEKFRNGVEAVLSADMEYFSTNETWQKRIPEIGALLNNSEPLQVRAVFIYSSIHSISSGRLSQFDKLVERFSHDDENYFSYSSYNLVSTVDWLTGADQPVGVPKAQLTIHYPGRLDSPYETVYGLIKLTDIAALYQEYGKKLVAANIRAYKGNTEVNDGILKTLRERPEIFVYYNNGLTAYCKRLSVFHSDKKNMDWKRFAVSGLSIVNGAQTLGAIDSRFEEAGDHHPEGYVFIKLISLERCENDVEFAYEITKTANYQNRIISQNFIAQEPYQKRIADVLALSEVYYHYRDDADIPSSDEHNFTFKEAATALGCLYQNNNCDIVARVLAHRESLWSLEVLDPDDPAKKTRYSLVFQSDRPARTVWRAVQAQSIVIDRLKQEGRVRTGVQKTFYENCRWLLLNAIFLRLRPEHGDEMFISPSDAEKLSVATLEYAEVLWTACETLGHVSRKTDGTGFESPRHLKSVFSDAADCARLRSKMLELLDKPQPAQAASEG
jgi:hypothetical protein